MTHVRNFKGIQFEVLRRKIDGRFNTLVDSLEVAYYGDRGPDGKFIPGTGWRNGVNAAWMGRTGAQWAALFGIDPAEPATAKAVFDRIHGMIWTLYTVIFHERNQIEASPIPAAKYDDEIDDADVVVGSKSADARARVRTFRTAHPGVFNRLKAWATGEGFAADIDA